MTRFGSIGAVIALCLCMSAAVRAEISPTMVKVSTGSQLAQWTVSSPKPKHKTPVIYLHGGPGMYTTATAIERGSAFRDAGFNTIYFDQAGGGKSMQIAAKDYTIERAVADLEALRTSLGHDKIILWGSSYGASLGAVYASRYPEHVAGIILTSPGSYPGTKAPHNYKITGRDKVKLGKDLSKAAGKIDRDGSAAEGALPQSTAGALFDDLVNADLMGGMVCKGSNIKPPLPGTGGNLYANRLIGKDLDKIRFKPTGTLKIPALILRGSCDFVAESSAQSFAAFFETTVTPIANTGHGMHENRQAIEAALATFALGPLSKVE